VALTPSPERSNWKVVIPESQSTLRESTCLTNMFVRVVSDDAHTQLRYQDRRCFCQGRFITRYGKRPVALAAKRTDKETFYSYTSFTTAADNISDDLEREEHYIFVRQRWIRPRTPTRQNSLLPEQGTHEDPMFITYKKELSSMDNPNVPVAYGGFNISTTRLLA